jgi:hypothetical protein
MNSTLAPLLLNLFYRRITAGFRVLPQVYILGATKCGTSSLAGLLWAHPAHVAPLAKELMYLQNLPGFHTNYEYHAALARLWGELQDGHSSFSVLGYRKFFPTWAAMLVRRVSTGRSISSDCDPFNLYCPTAMQRIARLPGTPKFIISLRDPVARAYSDFNMQFGARQSWSFEECIERELTGEQTAFRHCVLRQGIYEPHLRRWFATFGRQRFLILRMEDFADRAAEVVAQVFEFLELGHSAQDLPQLNARPYARAITPASEAILRAFFRPHNERLYSLLGRDMGWM